MSTDKATRFPALAQLLIEARRAEESDQDEPDDDHDGACEECDGSGVDEDGDPCEHCGGSGVEPEDSDEDEDQDEEDEDDKRRDEEDDNEDAE